MEWKVEYGIILFLSFAGVTYSLTQTETQNAGPIWKRLYAQFYAWLFSNVICIGFMLMLWGWNIVVVCVAAILLSPVSEHFISLWLQSQNSAKNVFQFIRRFRKTWDALEKEDNSTSDDNQHDP